MVKITNAVPAIWIASAILFECLFAVVALGWLLGCLQHRGTGE